MISCQECNQFATIHITHVHAPRSRLLEFHLCEPHARDLLGKPAANENAEWTARRHAQAPDGATWFDIETIIISEIGDQQVVYLREVGGRRRFPIVIGLFEATALDRNLKGFRSPRPLTHDGWASTISALGGEIEDVFIHDLQQHTYFARIRIRQAGRLVEIDVRPSDAFNMAIVCGVPICAAEKLASDVCAQGVTP